LIAVPVAARCDIVATGRDPIVARPDSSPAAA
jgi:hypothetical protein